MTSKYYDLRCVEFVKSKSDPDNIYTYYRGDRTSPRRRLPDRSAGKEMCMNAWIKAKQDYLASKNQSVKIYPTLKHVLQKYYEFIRPRLSVRSKKLYRSYMAKINKDFGPIYIIDVGEKAGIQFRDSFKSQSSAREHLKFLKATFKWACEHQILHLNVMNHVKLPPLRNQKGHQPWTDSEIEKFRQAYPGNSSPRLWLEFFLAIGCRISDAIRLKKSHFGTYIDHDFVHYKTQKTGVECSVCLPKALVARLFHVYEHNSHVFVHPRTGKPFKNVRTLRYHFQKAARAIGIHKTIHGLRNTVAIKFAEQLQSAEALKAVFGWRDIKTAERYIRQANRKKMGLDASAKFIRDTENMLQTSGALFPQKVPNLLSQHLHPID